MAYEPPNVRVSQVFQSPSPNVQAAELPAVVIGECYQVEKHVNAGAYDGTGATYSYTAKKSGAVIQTAEVKVEIEAADLTREDVTASATIDATDVDLPANLERTVQAEASDGQKNGKTFTSASSIFVSSGVRPGDFLRVSTSYYEISDVVGETEVTLLVTPTEANPITFTVVRKLTGTVRLEYVALRTDSAVVDQLLEFSSEEELQDTFGEDALDDPRSVLPFGAARCFRNAGTAIYAYTIDGQVSAGTAHAAARDALKTRRAYHIAPLTYDSGVISSYVSFVNAQSTADEADWCRVYIAKQIRESQTLSLSGDQDDGATDATGTVFTDPSATFQTDGVKAGDILILTTPDPDEERLIQSVDSQTQLTLEAAATANLTAQTYAIRRDYTRSQMAENLKAEGTSLANQRVTLIGTDQWKVAVDGTVATTAGYFGAAARAGLASSIPIGQPHTGKSISGFDAIGHANDVFSESQLNTIADGGTEVYTQATPTSAIVIRDALTTDRSAFNREAVPMVISRDWLSFVTHDTLKPQVASANITEQFLSRLQGVVQAIFNKALSLPDEAFSDIQLVKLEKNPTQSGRVTIEIQVTQGEPAKHIDVTLFV